MLAIPLGLSANSFLYDGIAVGATVYVVNNLERYVENRYLYFVVPSVLSAAKYKLLFILAVPLGLSTQSMLCGGAVVVSYIILDPDLRDS